MHKTLFELLGGDEAVRRLVDRFYDQMDIAAEFVVIRHMHPTSLEGSREKLYLFLCGWLGGPQRYVEKHGHPMMRRRHMPFAIGNTERDQWMRCMRQAMVDLEIPELLAADLEKAFYSLADHLRNHEG